MGVPRSILRCVSPGNLPSPWLSLCNIGYPSISSCVLFVVPPLCLQEVLHPLHVPPRVLTQYSFHCVPLMQPCSFLCSMELCTLSNNSPPWAWAYPCVYFYVAAEWEDVYCDTMPHCIQQCSPNCDWIWENPTFWRFHQNWDFAMFSTYIMS